MELRRKRDGPFGKTSSEGRPSRAGRGDSVFAGAIGG